MKDFFASLYEWLIYNPSCPLIFDTLYDNNSYILFAIIFLAIPLISLFVFYILYKNPYTTYFTWVIFLFSSIVLVFLITFAWAMREIYAVNPALIGELNKPLSAYKAYAALLPLKYALVNCFLAAILGVIVSLIFKQFSKVQTHLPV